MPSRTNRQTDVQYSGCVNSGMKGSIVSLCVSRHLLLLPRKKRVKTLGPQSSSFCMKRTLHGTPPFHGRTGRHGSRLRASVLLVGSRAKWFNVTFTLPSGQTTRYRRSKVPDEAGFHQKHGLPMVSLRSRAWKWCDISYTFTNSTGTERLQVLHSSNLQKALRREATCSLRTKPFHNLVT